MNIANIRPSTVDGVKQLAKKIRREQNIPHTRALDDASRQIGFENFVHAKRELARAGTRRFPIFLTIHWHAARRSNDEPRPDGRWAGREVLCVDLSRPLPEIVAKHRVGHGRGLHGFRMEYEDHLEFRTNVEGQDVARRRLLSAVRSLRFMEATGLQPVSTKQYAAPARTLSELPGHDHMSDWFDPVTGSYLCLDEPYAKAIEDLFKDRDRWLDNKGFKMVAPAWEGIYFAGECTPCLISPDGALLQRVCAALAKAPAVTDPETWPHETGMCNDDFVSPRRQADAKPRRPRPGPSWREHKGASPYGGALGIPSRWRPTKAMSVELHQQLGPLMQALVAGAFSWRVRRKLGAVRSTLDDWSYIEHRNEQERDAYNVYYGGPSAVCGDTEAERLSMLTTARGILERGYADCKPRRLLLAAFEAAICEIDGARAKNADARPVPDIGNSI